MNENWKEEYGRWLILPEFDDETKKELAALTDEKEIEDRFYRSLSFGTGGMRGLIGAGTNRMNLYTVGKATQGLADYINEKTDGSAGVVIAFDSRRMSAEFALSCALVLCANGIKAYLFDSLRPTPELSFAVRYLHATAGIVVTASHNPPAYNGYKVYWSDGGQVVPPVDREIIKKVDAVPDFSAVKRMSKEDALAAGLLQTIGKEVDEAYYAAVCERVLDRAAVKEEGKNLRVVYTPLHGTGNLPVRAVLKRLGFEQVFVVPEQELPDGRFPTVEYPNPEDPKAFALALALARKKDADVVLATDPDADRLGVYAKDARTGEYYPFTGNMSGLLIADYRLERLKETGKLPENRADGAIVTTIVSSDMVYPIAREYGLSVIRTLTGFKYIGEQIRLFEEAKEKNGGKTDAEKGAYEYLFGFEESYGCLAGTYARDKDAVAAVVALCEAAAHYKKEGKTLADKMREIYEKYGCYRERQKSVTLSGVDGAKGIAKRMERLRLSPPASIGGRAVKAVSDYLCSERTDIATGEKTAILLPRSDVLYFELEKEGWCCARPSGTEPKIKFYFGAKEESVSAAEEALDEMERDVLSLTQDGE